MTSKGPMSAWVVVASLAPLEAVQSCVTAEEVLLVLGGLGIWGQALGCALPHFWLQCTASSPAGE